MKIEVLIYERVGPYLAGQVVELGDGVFLRAMLQSGKADVVNPPDWTPELADQEKQVSNSVEIVEENQVSNSEVLNRTNESGKKEEVSEKTYKRSRSRNNTSLMGHENNSLNGNKE